MGTRKPEDIRTVALLSHGGAGKTSLAEAMLFDAGLTTRMGKVEDKNTVSDFDNEEHKRQISISTSLLTIPYRGSTVYVLDTPGFSDFQGEQICALRVVDSAVIVVSGVHGIEVQTQRGWEGAEEQGIPVAFFVSKMDREHADYDKVVGELKESFSDRVAPLFVPIGQEASFKGLVDVLSGKAYTYKGDGSKAFSEGPVPQELEDVVSSLRDSLVERIVEADDELMMRYLDGEEIKYEELVPALRKAIRQRLVFPVIPGSSTLNVGVLQLMDLLVDAMPSPVEMSPRKVLAADGTEKELAPDPSGPFYALCFKVMVDPYVGKLSFIRVFSGRTTADQGVFNVNRGEEERVSAFRLMRGKEGEDVKEVVVGDIVAIPKLEKAQVGDTLSSKGQSLKFPPITFPKPVYSVAVTPKSRADEDKLGNAIHKMLDEDKTLSFVKNPETGDSVLSGMGDLHIDIVLSKIKDRYKVDLETRTPKVPYREAIKKSAKAQGKYKKQTGGRGQYGDVWFELTPGERGSGIVFLDRIVGGVVPKNFIPAAEKGLREAAAKGVLAGYPAVDFVCALYDGSYHDVDSSEMAFKIAASMAFKKAFMDASPVLLEPIMNVEVTVPEECLGDVMGDFNGRRGRIMGIDSNGKLQVVKAQCPLAEMFRYAIILRSMTSGRGSFTMEFSHYEETPAEIAKKVIAAAAAERKEEEE
ncbi:elongation factor G [Thermanaerovibrio acidaminovorans]|uniref:elongation factor G n=1 Tax=Thermanaerovibrio acidaminovorans TaxID=81462 RepID=UPI002493A507|nr:elongation factor G [Thermanaerovibrio acidaminovorans]